MWSVYRIAGNSGGNFIWQFHEKWSKIDISCFNLAVVEWTWSLFIDNTPHINWNHACVLANHGDIGYRELRERGPRQSPNASGSRPLEECWFAKGNLRTLQMHKLQWWKIWSWSGTYRGGSPKYAHYFCTKAEQPTKQSTNYFWRILIWWFASKTANLPNFIPCQYFRLYGIRVQYAYKKE